MRWEGRAPAPRAHRQRAWTTTPHHVARTFHDTTTFHSHFTPVTWHAVNRARAAMSDPAKVLRAMRPGPRRPQRTPPPHPSAMRVGGSARRSTSRSRSQPCVRPSHTSESVSALVIQNHTSAFSTLSSDEAEEAELLCERAVGACRDIYGDRHHNTLVALNNLTSLLRSRGKLAAAEPHCLEACRIGMALHGAQHPDTLTALDFLFELLACQDRASELEPHLRSIHTRRAGKQHTERSHASLCSQPECAGSLSFRPARAVPRVASCALPPPPSPQWLSRTPSASCTELSEFLPSCLPVSAAFDKVASSGETLRRPGAVHAPTPFSTLVSDASAGACHHRPSMPTCPHLLHCAPHGRPGCVCAPRASPDAPSDGGVSPRALTQSRGESLSRGDGPAAASSSPSLTQGDSGSSVGSDMWEAVYNRAPHARATVGPAAGLSRTVEPSAPLLTPSASCSSIGSDEWEEVCSRASAGRAVDAWALATCPAHRDCAAPAAARSRTGSGHVSPVEHKRISWCLGSGDAAGSKAGSGARRAEWRGEDDDVQARLADWDFSSTCASPPENGHPRRPGQLHDAAVAPSLLEAGGGGIPLRGPVWELVKRAVKANEASAQFRALWDLV